MARALALNASKELAAGGAGQLTAKIMPLPQWLLAVSGDRRLENCKTHGRQRRCTLCLLAVHPDRLGVVDLDGVGGLHRGGVGSDGHEARVEPAILLRTRVRKAGLSDSVVLQ
jgi:hypothetical protein